MVEDRLHDLKGLQEPQIFALRQAAALGQHDIQQRYEKLEQETDRMIDLLLEVRAAEGDES